MRFLLIALLSMIAMAEHEPAPSLIYRLTGKGQVNDWSGNYTTPYITFPFNVTEHCVTGVIQPYCTKIVQYGAHYTGYSQYLGIHTGSYHNVTSLSDAMFTAGCGQGDPDIYNKTPATVTGNDTHFRVTFHGSTVVLNSLLAWNHATADNYLMSSAAVPIECMDASSNNQTVTAIKHCYKERWSATMGTPAQIALRFCSGNPNSSCASEEINSTCGELRDAGNCNSTQLSDWGDWGECVGDESGYEVRYRNTPPGVYSDYLLCRDIVRQQRSCTPLPPVNAYVEPVVPNCTFSDGGSWGNCSQPADHSLLGRQTKTRTVVSHNHPNAHCDDAEYTNKVAWCWKCTHHAEPSHQDSPPCNNETCGLNATNHTVYVVYNDLHTFNQALANTQADHRMNTEWKNYEVSNQISQGCAYGCALGSDAVQHNVLCGEEPREFPPADVFSNAPNAVLVPNETYTQFCSATSPCAVDCIEHCSLGTARCEHVNSDTCVGETECEHVTVTQLPSYGGKNCSFGLNTLGDHHLTGSDHFHDGNCMNPTCTPTQGNAFVARANMYNSFNCSGTPNITLTAGDCIRNEIEQDVVYLKSMNSTCANTSVELAFSDKDCTQQVAIDAVENDWVSDPGATHVGHTISICQPGDADDDGMFMSTNLTCTGFPDPPAPTPPAPTPPPQAPTPTPASSSSSHTDEIVGGTLGGIFLSVVIWRLWNKRRGSTAGAGDRTDAIDPGSGQLLKPADGMEMLRRPATHPSSNFNFI